MLECARASSPGRLALQEIAGFLVGLFATLPYVIHQHYGNGSYITAMHDAGGAKARSSQRGGQSAEGSCIVL